VLPVPVLPVLPVAPPLVLAPPVLPVLPVEPVLPVPVLPLGGLVLVVMFTFVPPAGGTPNQPDCENAHQATSARRTRPSSNPMTIPVLELSRVVVDVVGGVFTFTCPTRFSSVLDRNLMPAPWLAASVGSELITGLRFS
jgi:hypothetical protein